MLLPPLKGSSGLLLLGGGAGSGCMEYAAKARLAAGACEGCGPRGRAAPPPASHSSLSPAAGRTGSGGRRTGCRTARQVPSGRDRSLRADPRPVPSRHLRELHDWPETRGYLHTPHPLINPAHKAVGGVRASYVPRAASDGSAHSPWRAFLEAPHADRPRFSSAAARVALLPELLTWAIRGHLWAPPEAYFLLGTRWQKVCWKKNKRKSARVQ